MDIFGDFFTKWLPYVGGAAAVLVFLEGFIDSVVRPAVLKSASKRDDEFLERWVDAPLSFVSTALAYILRAGATTSAKKAVNAKAGAVAAGEV